MYTQHHPSGIKLLHFHRSGETPMWPSGKPPTEYRCFYFAAFPSPFVVLLLLCDFFLSESQPGGELLQPHFRPAGQGAWMHSTPLADDPMRLSVACTVLF